MTQFVEIVEGFRYLLTMLGFGFLDHFEALEMLVFCASKNKNKSNI